MPYLWENSDVRTVLVEKTDRLYRNFKDYVILEDYELNIHLVKEGQTTNKSKPWPNSKKSGFSNFFLTGGSVPGP